jgi:hypothetical protein
MIEGEEQPKDMPTPVLIACGVIFVAWTALNVYHSTQLFHKSQALTAAIDRVEHQKRKPSKLLGEATSDEEDYQRQSGHYTSYRRGKEVAQRNGRESGL